MDEEIGTVSKPSAAKQAPAPTRRRRSPPSRAPTAQTKRKPAAGKARKTSARRAARPTPAAAIDLIAQLGLVGLSSLESLVLASLATRAPLLLIGSHGSGKSLLLERLATALQLSWRHYNAALVNFDDLVGYPLPDEHGQLRFVETPASVWGAQVVFIDEISRARIDVQNRLFPIIHERRVQGIALDALEHRWAAMNPPGTDDDEGPYAGSQPLDLALADRFALQVAMPDWQDFDAAAQEAVIRAPEQGSHDDAGADWARAIGRTRTLLPVVQAQWAVSLARYVRLLVALLSQSGMVVSARRAGMIAGNIAAVHAARLAQDQQARIDDSAWLAVINSLPFAAAGLACDSGKLLTCHREAWRQAACKADDPMTRILTERDPLLRVVYALAASELPDGELTTIVTDALSTAADGSRHALAEWLFECGAMARLSVVAADAVAECYRDVACVEGFIDYARPSGPKHALWRKVQQYIGALPESPLLERQANLVVSLFATERLTDESDIDSALANYSAARNRLRDSGPERTA